MFRSVRKLWLVPTQRTSKLVPLTPVRFPTTKGLSSPPDLFLLPYIVYPALIEGFSIGYTGVHIQGHAYHMTRFIGRVEECLKV